MADEILVVTAFNATINAFQSFFLDFLSLLAVKDFEYIFDKTEHNWQNFKFYDR